MTVAGFWHSDGMHLLECDADGRLRPTAAFLRAYYMRPELQPLANSCAAEVSVHERLAADPFFAVTEAELAAMADAEAADNYRQVLAFRDLLTTAGTIEAAYLRLMCQPGVTIAPLFVDQMVHVIVHNVLRRCSDPIRLRTAELFFREQTVSTDDGRLMLADDETVAMHARRQRDGALLPPLAGAPQQVVLDVLGEDNKHIYWQRSDRFDTVIDFRYGTPAPDALARVIEAWLQHLLHVAARVEPRPSINDADWRWHIGLDREASMILDALYAGRTLPPADAERIVGLFRMHICDDALVRDDLKGKPVYLALAMDGERRVKMKPQNLLMNLPLAPPGRGVPGPLRV